MKYRADLDGLRAISVIAVLFFHSGFDFLSGGYVGVDIFFVISGYLITGLVYEEIKSGTFTYANFYKRRIARLLPALLLTLFLVTLSGFLFYDNKTLDNLGKEIFFSAVGAANILFGQGINYFAQEESGRPLIHLWSLGVEEQFYFIWPSLLLLLAMLRLRYMIAVVVAFILLSLSLAVAYVDDLPTQTYFYPQFRVYELLIGALTALGMKTHWYRDLYLGTRLRELLTLASLTVVVSSMFVLTESSVFPGINALYPCLGTAIFIALSEGTWTGKGLSLKPLVFIGLISYPLYLYHQPIISYIHFFQLTSNNSLIFLLVSFTAVPLSWLTYRYIEKPIRLCAREQKTSSSTHFVLLTSLAVFALSGIVIAKSNGLGLRFRVLNPFAFQVTSHSESTFHKFFRRGLNVSTDNDKRMLFIGDSVLQQYVLPLAKALNVEVDEIDTVTRGGCVLLKGVNFIDKFSDVSCNDIRDELYVLEKKYEIVVISQSWEMYQNDIINIPPGISRMSLDRWTPFLQRTIEHFDKLADVIIIIGPHVKVEGTPELKPSIFLSESEYKEALRNLTISNMDHLLGSRSFFDQLENQKKVHVLYPNDIWVESGERNYKLHNGKWAFFIDSQHSSVVGSDYIIQKLMNMPLIREINEEHRKKYRLTSFGLSVHTQKLSQEIEF